MRNNGLSIVLLGLFLACWAGQAVAGHAEYNSDQSEHRQPTVTLSDYWQPVISGKRRSRTGRVNSCRWLRSSF
jgi:hypothetical protein